MSTVTYSATFTRNMGDFESLKLTVGCSDEPRGVETTNQAFNRVKDFVESKLLDDIEALEKSILETRAAILSSETVQKKVRSAAEKANKEAK